MLTRYPFYTALLGLVTLLILIVVGGAAFPEYSHASQFISELGATDAPHEMWVRFAGFLPVGILSCIYLMGAFKRLPRSKFTTLGLAGIFVYALGYFAAVVFPCDPGCRPAEPSLSQGLHNLFGLVGYLVSPVFLFLFGLESRNWPNRGHLPLTAFVCAAAAALGLLTLDPASPWVGVSQRLVEAAVWIWIVFSAKYLSFALPNNANEATA